MFANVVRVLAEGRATWVLTSSLRSHLRIVLKKVELILFRQYVWRLSSNLKIGSRSRVVYLR